MANHYAAARGLPESNFVYMRPDAAGYAELAAVQLPGFFGELSARRIRDHLEYVVVPPGGSFYVSAPGLVSDGCFPVNRLAIASAYTLAFLEEDLLAGLANSTPNEYKTGAWEPLAFDGAQSWKLGSPSFASSSEQYFIGAMLGFDGPLGNTVDEVLAMIDRSVAADASHPAGTFYYMETTDVLRSGPRDFAYPQAVAEITSEGGAAEHLFANLPAGKHDCLGIMTGLANPAIDSTDMTILPGAFADHLTSFAGTFDTASQTKMSRWIAKGASGTAGAVEEPCNYSDKFPHARLHALYFRGATLGEAWFRSMGWAPFQNLLYGDPLTRPFAHPPAVDLPGVPAGPVAGAVALAPLATAAAPGAAVDALELYVDGVRVQTIADGESFLLDTAELADGWHELRVLALDDTPEQHAGRWVGSLTTSNAGRSAGLAATPLAGDRAQRFDFDLSAAGGPVSELRLLHGGRVVAAAPGSPATLSVYGQNLGAGPVRVRAEALFADGTRATSAPVDLSIAFQGSAPAGVLPTAFGYTRTAQRSLPFVLELPAAYDEDPAAAVYTVVQAPVQATVLGAGTGPYRILSPLPGAAGADSLSFRVDTPAGSSAAVTVQIQYVDELPLPGAPFFSLDAVSPDPVDALIPGTEQTVTLSGAGFTGKTRVELEGTPLATVPPAYGTQSAGAITVDMPQTAQLGPATFTVRDADGLHAANLAVTVAPPPGPVLQLALGNPIGVVPSQDGLDVLLSGTPGSQQLFLYSVSNTPSVLPGIVSLDLGNQFAQLFTVGTFAVDPVQGWTALHFPLAGAPFGLTLFAQTVELTPTLPVPASNLQQILIL